MSSPKDDVWVIDALHSRPRGVEVLALLFFVEIGDTVAVF